MDFQEIESKFKPMKNNNSAEATNGMVATAFPDATKAGVEILKKGGNAVDAAVAAAFAIGVCEPQASGLGGQTMMMIHIDRKVIVIDGSSRAPSLAHSKTIYHRDRSLGYRGTTVPSTPATLGYVHNRYGRFEWAKILEPAIRIAEEGYRITGLQHRLQIRELENFHKVESKLGAKYFLKEGKPYSVGDRLKQPELANLLRRLTEKGVQEFYNGKVAKQIDADMRKNGGLLRYNDLSQIPWPIERRPLKRKFRGLTIYTMPPPGGGRTLLFALLMIDAIPPRAFFEDSNKQYYFLAEVFRKALLERKDRPFDPNFYPQLSEKKMLNQKFAKQCILDIMSKVDTTFLPQISTDDELRGETTHLSTMDDEGMAVSLTQSIEGVYGSKAAAEGLGFLYNNYICDYEYKINTHPYYLRPNAVPWATVAPSLIFNKKELWMAVGSPGSERIFSSIAQFLLHVVDENFSICEAMEAPRLHCSLDRRVSLEAERFPGTLIEFLQEKGYRIDERESYSFYLGAIHAVLKKHDDSGFQGVADIRRDGNAGGY